MGSNDNVIVTNNTPFSIRNYVLAVRKKDICHNWPFPEKHLKLCMKFGISRVLPPFQSRDLVRSQSKGHDDGSDLAQEDRTIFHSTDKSNVSFVREADPMKIGNSLLIDEVVSEVSKCIGLLSISATRHDHGGKRGLNSNIVLHSMAPEVNPSTTNPVLNYNKDQHVVAAATTKKLRHKRKKRKGKPKKRSMVDICAEARPCTVEDLDKINGSTWAEMRSLAPCTNDQGAAKGENVANEVNESMITVDNNYRCVTAERFWKAKHPREENGNNSDVSDKKRRLMTFKLNGCKLKPQKRQAAPLRKK